MIGWIRIVFALLAVAVTFPISVPVLLYGRSRRLKSIRVSLLRSVYERKSYELTVKALMQTGMHSNAAENLISDMEAEGTLITYPVRLPGHKEPVMYVRVRRPNDPYPLHSARRGRTLLSALTGEGSTK